MKSFFFFKLWNDSGVQWKLKWNSTGVWESFEELLLAVCFWEILCGRQSIMEKGENLFVKDTKTRLNLLQNSWGFFYPSDSMW